MISDLIAPGFDCSNRIERISESSQYLATLLRRPEYERWLCGERNLYRRYPLTELYNDLQRLASAAADYQRLMAAFREFKQRHFLRIGGRDCLGMASLAETTSQLSDLAGVALQIGLQSLSEHPEWWMAESERAGWRELRNDLRLTVMGLGKLGGQELNYVSDIDILFLHALHSGNNPLPSESLVLISRLAQWTARLISDRCEGDRVFQVDFRLRPQGKDGPLTPSMAAALEHYLLFGHPWERQMLLKARPAAGDRSLGAAFLKDVRPFVFRRFLDFQALDELRAMRDKIIAEALRPLSGWESFDVKLGIGGIREVEFLVQSFQLIYGGRHTELDEPNTLRCLDKLENLKLLSGDAVRELKECYTFLRRVEHWVQLDQNRQTQKLPQSPEAKNRLSLALGFGDDATAFLRHLEVCCAAVHNHFLSLFQSDGKGRSKTGEDASSDAGPSQKAHNLEGFPPESIARLKTCLSVFPLFLQETVMSVLSGFEDLEDLELADKIVGRLERYFNLVRKRPGLVKVFASSAPWLADFCMALARSELLSALLAHNPSLVEGVATTERRVPGVDEWERAAEQILGGTRDYEESLEWVRRLKNERFLQLILLDLRGDLDHGAIEKALSALADFVIRKTYEQVLESLHLNKGLSVAVLALGKLGSREMTYLSDLDLVFVYRPAPGESEELIPEDVIRLIQRFMRMLSTPLQEGPGYSVDARLRPTGNYGPLAVTDKAWMKYYQEEADIWEAQALIRVRCVAGDEKLGRWIEDRAKEICFKKRDAEAVWGRLCHLRMRMQLERADERRDHLDLKLGLGGLADIEFLVQGYLLVEGWRNNSLRFPSVRSALEPVLESLAEIAASERDIRGAFEALRSLEHRLRLHTNQSSSRVTPSQFESLKAVGLWPPADKGVLLEDWQDLLRLRRRVRALLRCFCPDLQSASVAT